MNNQSAAIGVNERFFADSMGFVGLQGQPPLFCQSNRPQLSLVHLTSVSPDRRRFDQTMEMHHIFREQVLSNSNVHEIRVSDDLLGKPESMGILFGLQHAPADLTFDRVRELSNAGIRSMAIAYENSNEYGDGFRCEGPLTERGAQLVRWLGECKIILDLSHAAPCTAADALAVASRGRAPTMVMASHSGCRAVRQHPRNLSGVLMWEIKRLKGYIGIPATTYLIAEKDDLYLERFVSHVEHAIDVCGDSTIGIGSNCNHIDMSKEDARIHFWNMSELKGNEDFGEYFPDRPPELIDQGSRMFGIFEERLLKKYSLPIVRNLCGLNFRRFIFRSLPRA